MKIKYTVLPFALAAVLAAGVVGGCGGGVGYSGGKLDDATVGVEYYENVATAVSEEGVEYRLAADSSLPAGLTFENGIISGIPSAAAAESSFTVEVYTNGKKAASASFTLTVQRGKIEYNDTSAYSIVDEADSGTVAFATGSPDITYELVDGRLPGDMSIAPDGTILGVWSRTMRNRELTVRASAPDCESDEAVINFNVIYPYLDFTGRTLVDAKAGVEYAASVAYVENAAEVTYSLKEGSSLPAGLTLSEDGLITGVSPDVMRGTPFTVVAEADDYTATEAEFLIDVIMNRESDAEGEILNFRGGELTEVYQDTYYLNQQGVSAGALALNNNNITYKLAEGSALPEGLALYPNGAIFGQVSGINDYEFDVIASAVGCEDVRATFTLSVVGSRIEYAETISADTATRSEAYSFSVATANAGEGVEVTYTVSEDDKKKLADIGLAMDEEGLVTGTPTRSLKTMNFSVTASAEGYTSSVATVYLHIQEPLTAATVFEAEFTDLAGKTGTGYSGSPSAEGLIGNGSAYGASNGYYVGYMHNSNISLEFNIEAEEDTAATLILRLGSEFGNVTLTPSAFGVSVNGSEISYSGLNVPGGASGYTSFADCVVGTVQLKKGMNEIKLSVRSNTLRNGQIGGPGVDCIKLEGASCTLRWRPLVYNFDAVKV